MNRIKRDKGLIQFGAAMLLLGLLWLTCAPKQPMDPTESIQAQVTILADMTAAPSQVVMGGNQSTVRVRLIDEQGDPLAGETISFSCSLGSITQSDETDSDGWAQVVFTSGTETGEATVTARYGSQVSTVTTIKILSYEAGMLQIETARSSILANGIDSTAVLVTVLGDSALPVQGALVSFSTSAGSIASTAMTNSEGVAEAYLYSDASKSDMAALVTAVYDSLSSQISVSFRGVSITASAFSSEILADGQSTSTISVILKESTSKVAISGARVIFATNAGTIPRSALSNSSGVAQADLTSSNAADSAEVIIRYGSTLSDTVTVVFVEQTGVTYTLSSLMRSAPVLLANGVDQSIISTRVTDVSGNPVSGITVNFTASAGEIASSVVTSSDGRAQATLIAAASSTDIISTVTASLGTQSVQTQVSLAGVSMLLLAQPDTILADGQSASSVMLILKRTTSNEAVANETIRFSATLGTIPYQISTDAAGVARATLTSVTSTGTSRIIARYGQELSDTALVVFSNQAPTQYVLQSLTAGKTEIIANGVSQAVITAKITDNDGNPVSGVPVVFLTTSGSIESQAISNTDGTATAHLTSLASSSDVTATVTARLDQSSSRNINIIFQGLTLTLSAMPDSILADGQSTSSIMAVLKRTATQVAVNGETINFGTDLGTIPAEAQTNISGVAQVDLTSSTQIGQAQVVARYGNLITDTVYVAMQESVPYYLQVTASPPVITADGQSQSTISASVSDINRNPVPDGTMVYYRLFGSGTLQRNAQGTSSGVSSNYLTAGATPDTAQVEVRVGSLRDTVEIVYKVGPADQILVSTNKDSIMADGKETAIITARVLDAQGTPIRNATVNFASSLGDVTPTAQTGTDGRATAQFSSGEVGTATVTASVNLAGGGTASGNTTIVLVPGGPNSILLHFDPQTIGVRGTGQNQTAIIEAEVRDAKNNPVEDGTNVTFSIVHGPGGGEFLTPGPADMPIPTVGGMARVSISSGTISGNVRVQAQTTGSQGNIIATASEILIHAGPPFMLDRTDYSSTHLTVAAEQLNIWRTLGTTNMHLAVFDKYHNPVQQGTAVYLTSSGGGVSTHTALTDADGKATVILTAGNNQPKISDYYNGELMQDPNFPNTILPGPIAYSAPGSPTGMEYLLPDFENSLVANSMADSFATCPRYQGNPVVMEYDSLENDGIARIVAYTEGQDQNGDSVRVWDQITVVFSGAVGYNDDSQTSLAWDSLGPGESATMIFSLMDDNGNPIEARSDITASLTSEVDAALSWTALNTGDGWGTVYYALTIFNKVDPTSPNPKLGPTTIKISWTGDHQFGEAISKVGVIITS